jgi:hypothetical protein
VLDRRTPASYIRARHPHLGPQLSHMY